MNIQNINRRNTREWAKVNTDSKSNLWREKIISEHGGIFFREGKEWKWTPDKPKPISKPKTNWIFIHPDGKEELVENLSKFCRKHQLNKAAMYEVYNGKRNHHKQFKLKKQGD
jgi:hypothetical protein